MFRIPTIDLGAWLVLSRSHLSDARLGSVCSKHGGNDQIYLRNLRKPNKDNCLRLGQQFYSRFSTVESHATCILYIYTVYTYSIYTYIYIIYIYIYIYTSYLYTCYFSRKVLNIVSGSHLPFLCDYLAWPDMILPEHRIYDRL